MEYFKGNTKITFMIKKSANTVNSKFTIGSS